MDAINPTLLQDAYSHGVNDQNPTAPEVTEANPTDERASELFIAIVASPSPSPNPAESEDEDTFTHDVPQGVAAPLAGGGSAGAFMAGLPTSVSPHFSGALHFSGTSFTATSFSSASASASATPFSSGATSASATPFSLTGRGSSRFRAFSVRPPVDFRAGLTPEQRAIFALGDLWVKPLTSEKQ